MVRKTQSSWFLKAWRKHRGYTQERLAEMTGLSKPYVSQLEGGGPYNQRLLELLAEALRCTPADLIMRDPSDPDGLWSIYDQLKPVDRQQLVAMARVITRTGTDN